LEPLPKGVGLTSRRPLKCCFLAVRRVDNNKMTSRTIIMLLERVKNNLPVIKGRQRCCNPGVHRDDNNLNLDFNTFGTYHSSPLVSKKAILESLPKDVGLTSRRPLKCCNLAVRRVDNNKMTSRTHIMLLERVKNKIYP
jgi:hypothetical protein